MAKTYYDEAARERSRRFEAARCAAMALCAGLTGDDRRDPSACITDAATIERYRWLIIAMGIARADPGGLAIAALVQRGYVLGRTAPFRRPDPGVLPLTDAGVVWFGGGLPGCFGWRWASMMQQALRMDVDALPPIHIASAHDALRIKSELRREGHDVG